MVSERGDAAGDGRSRLIGSTMRREQARTTITQTTVTPAPDAELDDASGRVARPSLIDRFRLHRVVHGELTAAREPYAGTHVLRFALATLLSVICLLTVCGAILMLLLWQQDRDAGVLTSQLDRTWDLFDMLGQIERLVAFATIPVAVAWIALATINVRRATGNRRNPVVAALSLVVALAGIWLIGDRIIAEANDWIGEASGLVLQSIFVAIPMLALVRIADAAEARHRPLRATGLVAVAYLVQLQFMGSLSNLDRTNVTGDWGKVGAYLIIAALILAIGTLFANEAARAIEEGTDHRYQLRHRFGESVLSQVGPVAGNGR
jgi:hypothetical protein